MYVLSLRGQTKRGLPVASSKPNWQLYEKNMQGVANIQFRPLIDLANIWSQNYIESVFRYISDKRRCI